MSSILIGQLTLKQVNTLYQTGIAKNCLVLRSIVNSILTNILKRLLKKPVRRYMLWLELHLLCVFQIKKLLMNPFFKAQFFYCSLVQMCHSGQMNNKINRLHERCLEGIFIMIKCRLLRIYQQKMDLSPHTQEIYKFFPRKCLKYIKTCQ